MGVTYNQPIIIITLSGSLHDMLHDPIQQEVDARMRERVQQTPSKDYIIADISAAEMNFSDLVMALGEMRSDMERMGGKEFVESNMEYLLVGSGQLAEMMVNAMNQKQYGEIHAHLFGTVDEVLTYARERIKRETG